MAQMFFNDTEAVRIAQTMETNGLAFYEQAAGRSRSPQVRETFLQLAEDERKHLSTFRELQQTLAARRADPPPAAEDADSLGPYIDGLLKTQVFSRQGAVAKLSGQAADDLEALAVGMKAERDSILFYQEMLDFVDSKEAQAAFSWILKEERKHLQTLSERSQQCAGMTP